MMSVYLYLDEPHREALVLGCWNIIGHYAIYEQ